MDTFHSFAFRLFILSEYGSRGTLGGQANQPNRLILVRVRSIWLPNPEIIRTTIEKVLRAFENVIQTELIRVRWEEIKKLQVNTISLKT
ncbi:MAG: hypothetical protein A3G66_03940 [Candidatus Levybacteria bacterium RIFCSPLOWO2_12_FULL_39_17]|nr:MAG: hypothetical protein A3G66_03940 [Candidatus Levybacteria bacterium RIFCSPLOWO2_12_FULL_39_17]